MSWPVLGEGKDVQAEKIPEDDARPEQHRREHFASLVRRDRRQQDEGAETGVAEHDDYGYRTSPSPQTPQTVGRRSGERAVHEQTGSDLMTLLDLPHEERRDDRGAQGEQRGHHAERAPGRGVNRRRL